MEGRDKKTVRILRELAADWKAGSLPGRLLGYTANVLETFFEDFSWEESAAETQEDTDAEKQG